MLRDFARVQGISLSARPAARYLYFHYCLQILRRAWKAGPGEKAAHILLDEFGEMLWGETVATQVFKKFTSQRNNDGKVHPLQADIDTFCQKLLDRYFTTPEESYTETQSYPDSKKSLKKANIAVKSADGGELKTTIILEAKHFPRGQSLLPSKWYETNRTVWKKATEQLRKYMVSARGKDKWQHHIHGIVYSTAEGIIEKLRIYTWPRGIKNDQKLILAFFTAHGRSQDISLSSTSFITRDLPHFK